jgi:hypothetical protein
VLELGLSSLPTPASRLLPTRRGHHGGRATVDYHTNVQCDGSYDGRYFVLKGPALHAADTTQLALTGILRPLTTPKDRRLVWFVRVLDSRHIDHKVVLESNIMQRTGYIRFIPRAGQKEFLCERADLGTFRIVKDKESIANTLFKSGHPEDNLGCVEQRRGTGGARHWKLKAIFRQKYKSTTRVGLLTVNIYIACAIIII